MFRSRPATGSLGVRPAILAALVSGAFLSSPILTSVSAQEKAPLADPLPSLERRAPWTTSRITGSPETPMPYVTRRVFPKLKFVNLVDLCNAPGTERLFVLEQGGAVYSFTPNAELEKADPLLDLRKRVPDFNAAYGMTFHPGFVTNRYFYVCYVLKDGLPEGSRVSRFKMTKLDPPEVDPASETVLITWLSGGHNGGALQFGLDGHLYISTGDGTGPNPPDILMTGQDNSDLLSSVLRIDVDHPDAGKPYRVPLDNPFVHTPGCRPEIWCYGFRNPWKMSIDKKTGALWVGDVGWELWELVYRVEKGGNYGWSIVEGRQPVHPTGKRGPTPILPPTVEHPHSEAASITGGIVYHGKRLKELAGAYVYGDWQTGKMWALWHNGPKVTRLEEIARTGIQIVVFAEDNASELYAADYASGSIHQLEPNPERGAPAKFPQRLSETGLFASVKDHRLAPGVVGYSINAELWTDSATTERFIAFPGTNNIQVTSNGWAWPKDTVLAKTFSLELERGKPASRHRLETQVLHLDGAWRAYTYTWNDEQTDATLVDAAGAERAFEVIDRDAPGGRRKQTWRYYSRTECLRCHNSWDGYVLAFNREQLNKDHCYESANRTNRSHAKPGIIGNQLQALARVGVFSQPIGDKSSPRFPNPRDASADLNERARAWLHINCAHCHRNGAGGSVVSEMPYGMPLENAKLVGQTPSQGAFGMVGAHVITAGDPYRSVLYYRISTESGGHMPRLGSSFVDVEGAQVIHDWIKQLPLSLAAKQKDDPAATKLAAENETALRQLASATSSGPAAPAELVDRLLASTSGALALLHEVSQHAFSEPLRTEIIEKAATHASVQVRDLFERFLPDEKRPKKLGATFNVAEILSLTGDAANGKKIFFQDGGAQCYTCHRADGEGRDFGPDLSHVATKFDRAQLLDNILNPSKLIDPAFVSYTVETKDEQSYSGLLVKQTDDEILLKDATAQEIHLAKTKVKTLQPQQLSAMPEGLLQTMTAPAVADLLEFLSTLR